jgi:hypothetical protein
VSCKGSVIDSCRELAAVVIGHLYLRGRIRYIRRLLTLSRLYRRLKHCSLLSKREEIPRMKVDQGREDPLLGEVIENHHREELIVEPERKEEVKKGNQEKEEEALAQKKEENDTSKSNKATMIMNRRMTGTGILKGSK